MQFEVVFLLLFGTLSPTYSAPREGLPLLSPGGIGGIFEGPDSETIIRGPDGSEITSEQKGGAVIRDDGLLNQPIVVPEPELKYAAPILTEERVALADSIIYSTGAPIFATAAESLASPGPILAPQQIPLLTGETYAPAAEFITGYAEGPLVIPEAAIIDAKPIEIVQQDPHIIETEIIEAPDVEPDQSSDLKGPSGRVITRGSASIVSGPASTTITEPRKIIVAPPKIAIGTPVIATATIPLREVPLAAPLPDIAVPLPDLASTLSAITASSIVSLPSEAYEASSSLAPAALSYSTTAVPVGYGYSTTATPLVDELAITSAESTRIDLGANDFRQSIPVVEYSSSNGIVNGPAFLNAGIFSSTQPPIVSSSVATSTSDKFAPTDSPAVPRAYFVAPAASQNVASVPQAQSLVSSTASPYVQKIPRIEDSIVADGRVDMGYPSYKKSYQLPQILGQALSQFYQKTPIKDKDTVTIDDKMGELSQNEITSYDTRQFLASPDLSRAQYISPALIRNGIDASQVNLAPVPLSQVRRLPDSAYRRSYDSGYLENRYQRNVKRRSN